jgi:hypothetical protein
LWWCDFLLRPQFPDDAYFSKVSLFFGGIGWPDGQDLGPDTLAAALRPNTKIEKAS